MNRDQSVSTPPSYISRLRSIDNRLPRMELSFRGRDRVSLVVRERQVQRTPESEEPANYRPDEDKIAHVSPLAATLPGRCLALVLFSSYTYATRMMARKTNSKLKSLHHVPSNGPSCGAATEIRPPDGRGRQERAPIPIGGGMARTDAVNW